MPGTCPAHAHWLARITFTRLLHHGTASRPPTQTSRSGAPRCTRLVPALRPCPIRIVSRPVSGATRAGTCIALHVRRPGRVREPGVQWRSLGAHRRRRLHLRFRNLEAAVCRRLLFFEICLGSCDEKFHASDVGNQRTGVCPHHQHIVTIKTIATSA